MRILYKTVGDHQEINPEKLCCHSLPFREKMFYQKCFQFDVYWHLNVNFNVIAALFSSIQNIGWGHFVNAYLPTK